MESSLPKKLADFLGALPQAPKILIPFLLLLLIGYLDHATGEEIGFSLFYLIPVAFSAWFLGAGYGFAFSCLCSLAAYIDIVLDETKFTHPAIPFWNAFLIHLGALIVVAYLLSRLRFVLAYERKTRINAANNSQLKSMMVAMVSHEFGNALAQIGPAVFLLREGEGGSVPQQREMLYTVLNKVQQNLKAIVGNFLNLSRLESGNFVAPDKEVDLAALTVNSLEIFSILINERGIRVNFDHPSQIPSVTGDPEALTLVLHNLIGNAVKYTPPGGSVTIKIVPPQGSGGRLLVSIEDTGIGVPKEDAERIFSGFYRSKESSKMAKGIGVGLKVSREIIERHGGELKTEALPEKGSRFYFSLPCSALSNKSRRG
jgi:signal transduction histidine kinase